MDGTMTEMLIGAGCTNHDGIGPIASLRWEDHAKHCIRL